MFENRVLQTLQRYKLDRQTKTDKLWTLQNNGRTLQTMNIRIDDDTAVLLNTYRTDKLRSYNDIIRNQFGMPVDKGTNKPLRFQNIIDMEVKTELVIPWCAPASKEQSTMNQAINRAMNKIPGRKYYIINVADGIHIQRVQ